jgi:drug/metabolite transporter (DMT)-like permease
VSRRSWLSFLALSIIWGLPYLLIRVAVRQLDPVTLVFLRTLPAGIILIPWAARSGKFHALRGHLAWVAAYGFCEFGIPWVFMGRAEKHLSSSLTALLVAAVPLLGALLYRFTHAAERLSRKRSLGLVVGAGGVALAVGLNTAGSSWVSLLEMSVAVLGYTLGPLIIATKLRELPGIAVIAASLLFVGLAYSPWGFSHLPTTWQVETIWSVVLLILLPTLSGFLLFFGLIVDAGPARATVVTYVNPAVAIILGILILSEPITIGLLLGFPLIIAGSIFATSGASPDERRIQNSLPGDAEAP